MQETFAKIGAVTGLNHDGMREGATMKNYKHAWRGIRGRPKPAPFAESYGFLIAGGLRYVSCVGCTIPRAPEKCPGNGKVSNVPAIEEIS